jgi:hypothetical protein
MNRLPRQPVSSPIFRICDRDYDPWTLRPWASAGSNGTFGHRWDDPKKADPAEKFRAIYAAATRVASFVETLQGFIPTPELVAWRKLTTYDPDDGPSSLPPGVVPSEWAAENVMGRANVDAVFADVATSDALWYLHEQLATLVVALRLSPFEFDLSALFARSPRDLSQAVARIVFDDADRFAGITCPSRLGIDLLNVTLFEDLDSGDETTRAPLSNTGSDPISPDDPDLLQAVAKLRLQIG